MTTYVINGGDLLKAACSFNLIDIFAHGANCWSTMGAGIALHIGNNFPALREVDANDPRGPEQRLGGMSYAFDHSTGVWGANLYTQFYPGPNARMPSVISSVQTMFEQVHEIVEASKDETVYVGLPAIGCGIGGLNLYDVVRQVEALAETLYEDTRCRVVPVFYIMEVDKFAEDMENLNALDDDINVVDSEEEIIRVEGVNNDMRV
ncbi:hypothetical protein INC21_003109 [Salmonella enterica]|nr:hypothetical protein [Salmonella enterica]